MTYTLHHGDALDVLSGLPSCSVDAVVTDPPAGIAFMGKEWDRDHGGREGWVRAFAAIFAECYRVTKPGGRMLCWSIPRTSHWTGCAIEDAGWLIENRLAHFFGSGFPKGKSQLKPAVEDWWLARKPGGKVPALNIDECRVGTGADKGIGPVTNRDAARGSMSGPLAAVPTNTTAGRWPPNLLLSHAPGCVEVGTRRVKGTALHGKPTMGTVGARTDGLAGGGRPMSTVDYADPDGRETVAAWQCVDGCPVKMLDEQSGILTSNGGKGAHVIRSNPGTMGYGGSAVGFDCNVYGDTGTASRFFPQFTPDPFLYAPKASRRERNAGCEGLPEVPCGIMEDDAYPIRTGAGNLRDTRRANHHPTVKPQALMRWLCRLIAKRGEIVLDPFAGSGSTGVAALTEGMQFVGVEREAEYVEIARRRLDAAANTPQQRALAF